MSSSTYVARVELELDPEKPLELEVLRIEGVEAISRPFELTVRFHVPPVPADEEDPFALPDLPGTAARLAIVAIETDGTERPVRTFHGIVAEVQDDFAPSLEVGRAPTIKIVPRLALLDNITTQEVFVGQSVPDLIRHKLSAMDLKEGTDFVLRLNDPKVYVVADAALAGKHGDGAKAPVPPEPRLVVQYKESDLAFLSRLTEHVGISYFFEYDPDLGKDVVVFTDHAGGFTPVPKDTSFAFRDGGGERGVTGLARRIRSVPTTFYVLDYNYRAPDLTLRDADGHHVFDGVGAKVELDANSPGAVVEYAPNAKSVDEAGLIARVRAEEVEALRDRWVGLGDHAALAAGATFLVSGHPTLADDQKLVGVEVRHAFERTGSFSASTATSGPKAAAVSATPRTSYSCEFQAVFASKKAASAGGLMVYRPERRTPKPRIHGVVTAVVQGATAGPAIYNHLDDQGRYRVRFHFDGAGATPPRLRLAQPHAGPNYGFHFPLRPGVEVVVGFLDGDPDRPVILGAVPNPHTGSPVVTPQTNLPDTYEVHRIRTRSGIVFEIGDGDPIDAVVPKS